MTYYSKVFQMVFDKKMIFGVFQNLRFCENLPKKSRNFESQVLAPKSY